MAELTEKKFGYVVNSPHHCHPPCPPPPRPIPPSMTVKDWMEYINSYIDVRARQIYDKLKKLIPGGGSSSEVWPKDFILLRDISTNQVYEVYMENGSLSSRPHQGS